MYDTRVDFKKQRWAALYLMSMSSSPTNILEPLRTLRAWQQYFANTQAK